MDRRRAAEARRVFHGRARPLSRRSTARSMRCCAGSTRCRGGPISRRVICSARERRALALARGLDVGPELLWAGRQALVRGFIDGVALHLAKPLGDVAYFRSAKAALRKLHRAGICHNDLAKEQNWLRGSDGRAYLTDFQLAACFKTREPAVPDRGLRGSPASAEAQAQLRTRRADAEGAQDSGAQIVRRQPLARDRQEGLPRHHPRPVQFHRSRRRRPAAGQRRAGADRSDPEESRRPRYRHRRLRRPPHRRRALCLCRGRPDRAGSAIAQRTHGGEGPKAAGAYPGGAGPAARRRRQAAHRNPAARRDEPARSDRADDDERCRPRVPEEHSGIAEEFARSVQFRSGGSELPRVIRRRDPTCIGRSRDRRCAVISLRTARDCDARHNVHSVRSLDVA